MSWSESLTGRLGDLAGLALDALPDWTDPAGSGLYSHKTYVRSERYVNEGANALYTAVCLVGLLSHGSRRAIDLADAKRFDALAAASGNAGPSAVAAILWAFALADDGRSATFLSQLKSTDPSRVTAMDLGLILSAAALTAERQPALRGRAMDVARAAAPELVGRFVNRASVFRGPARVASRRDVIHKHVTSFASQVYPIHGLAEYARVTGEPLPPEARRAANHVVAAQGQFGQWWWMYHTGSGSVLDGYPVYVVHQDAMAFLALAPLQNLGVASYAEPLTLGLRWMFGDNELRECLVWRDPPFFGRAIQRTGSDADHFGGMSRADHARLVIGSVVGRGKGVRAAPDQLEVLAEDRSYHLGWLLYATALTQGWDDSSEP